jgi:hypothetical protein
LLDRNAATGDKILKNKKAQLASLKAEQSMRENLLKEREN